METEVIEYLKAEREKTGWEYMNELQLYNRFGVEVRHTLNNLYKKGTIKIAHGINNKLVKLIS